MGIGRRSWVKLATAAISTRTRIFHSRQIYRPATFCFSILHYRYFFCVCVSLRQLHRGTVETAWTVLPPLATMSANPVVCRPFGRCHRSVEIERDGQQACAAWLRPSTLRWTIFLPPASLRASAGESSRPRTLCDTFATAATQGALRA